MRMVLRRITANRQMYIETMQRFPFNVSTHGYMKLNARTTEALRKTKENAVDFQVARNVATET